jgi:hypothetical protein
MAYLGENGVLANGYIIKPILFGVAGYQPGNGQKAY